jgi:hypothetical protein
MARASAARGWGARGGAATPPAGPPSVTEASLLAPAAIAPAGTAARPRWRTRHPGAAAAAAAPWNGARGPPAGGRVRRKARRAVQRAARVVPTGRRAHRRRCRSDLIAVGVSGSHCGLYRTHSPGAFAKESQNRDSSGFPTSPRERTVSIGRLACSVHRQLTATRSAPAAAAEPRRRARRSRRRAAPLPPPSLRRARAARAPPAPPRGAH